MTPGQRPGSLHTDTPYKGAEKDLARAGRKTRQVNSKPNEDGELKGTVPLKSD